MKVITYLILVFCLQKCACFGDGGISWRIEVVNNLSYPIHAIVIFGSNNNRLLRSILPGEIADRIEGYIDKDIPPEAHRKIHKISVFSESKAPLMILESKEMDEYVIYIERKEYGYLFRLEVKEDCIGMGLNKKVDFKEEIDEYQIDQLTN
jgi:hypothetical protein